jgi:serine-type D-Ala-D-Ala carboxypeptidase (penicillin-binding protein 5/6)
MIRLAGLCRPLLTSAMLALAATVAAAPATPPVVAPPPAPVPAVPTAAVPTPAAMPVPQAPSVPGRAWILMDHPTGRVLAGHDIHRPLDPASITKVMTSYVLAAEMAAGKAGPDDEVFISENAWKQGGAGTDGSFSALAVNSRVKLSDVEHGLVIQSGNDAAIAIAEHIAGSHEAFAELMNQYARKLGMQNSHFVNAHGLTADGHKMSAHDIALLSRALIRDHPEHYALHAIKEYTYNGIRQYNRNGLLWKDDSVDGIKTGHTSAAGYCLAASAKRGEQRLISVVLGIEGNRREGFRQREEANLALLNWGFRFFETHTLYPAGSPIAEPKLWKGSAATLPLGLEQPLVVTIPRDRYGDLVAGLDLPAQLVAPFSRGQQVGTVRVTLDGEAVAERPLIALDDAPAAGFFKRMSDGFWMWWES